MQGQLTGRTRYRAGGFLNTRLVLQIEIVGPPAPVPGTFELRWRDASTTDLAVLARIERMQIEQQAEAARHEADYMRQLAQEIPGARKPH